MSSNYPEGSMRGSGIYSVEVSYDAFDCENEDCEKHNEAGDTATDDWGDYTIDCEFCGATYSESSLSQDKDDYYADYSEDR
jgi:aspartate carbamoyltransferase regulatory subunit